MRRCEFEIELRTRNRTNGSHGNHFAEAAKNKRERSAAALFTRSKTPTVEPLLLVRLTRISAGTMDDDGLRAALKSVRDGIAQRFRIDDASPLVRWEYAQEHGERKHYAVRVLIQTAEQAIEAVTT
jgi:hypothetical protein